MPLLARGRDLLPLAAVCLGAPAAQQEPPGPGAGTWIDPGARFAFTPPAGWRTLTPDEGRTLRARGDSGIPEQHLTPEPPRAFVFGAVDRWLAGSFDGRVLSVARQEGEPEVSAATLAGLRQHYAELSARGPRRFTVEDLQVGAVGADRHPALLGVLGVTEDSTQSAQFHAYVPSGGDTFIFALTWPAADRAAGQAAFAAMCDSMRIAAPARGAPRLGSKLLWAAVVGLAIGAALHALRKRLRR